MIAGRRVAMLVIGLLAAGQLVLAAALSGVTLANVTTPGGSFGASAPAGSLAIASGQTALLYICGSLPFFLGGELGGDPRQAFRTTRRGLLGAYLATVVVIIAAVAPLAADPALTRGEIPGMAVAERFAGHAHAVAVRAVAQPARHLRRLPEVRRPAGRPGAAGPGAGGHRGVPRWPRRPVLRVLATDRSENSNSFC